jgi:hypothetical protein
MNNATKLLLNKIAKSNSNPSSIQQAQLDVLEMVLNGKDVIDPSNAAALIMEMNATAVAAGISFSESVSRAMYPKLAIGEKDLYNHISTFEMIDIFATPAGTNINMLIPMENIKRYMTPTENRLVKYLVIPKHYKITVRDYIFSVCYPIFINVINNNTVQTLYDTTEENPLMILTSNSLEHRPMYVNGVNYLQITIPVLQYDIKSDIFVLSDAAIFEKTITFSDRFCMIRAYLKINNVWTEIDVTYSDKVYDINKPTILAKIVSGLITVSLPLIYQFLRTSGSVVRIDTYTTLGILNVDLSQVPAGNFSGVYENLDTTNTDLGLAAFKKINDIAFYSTDRITGGSNEAGFDEMRNRVIYGANSAIVSKLPSDLKTKLMVKGYSLSTLLDNITNRVYLTEKAVTSRELDGLEITPLTTNFLTKINPVDAISGDYTKTIKNFSGTRYTVLKDALYKLENGDLTYLSDTEIAVIENLSAANLCKRLNDYRYFYSPFYAVIDDVNRNIISRVYYLDTPLVIGKRLNAVNIYGNYNIVTTDSAIVLNGDQYELVLTASIPSGLINVNCQLTFYNKNDGTFIYLLNDSKTFTSNSGTFVFKLTTNFDINENHEIMFTNFINSEAVETPYYFPLSSEFNIFYNVTETSGAGLPTTFDSLFYKDSNGIVGATYESITLELGKYMDGLYAPINTYILAKEYQTYVEQVFATYDADVYERDEHGPILTIVDGVVTRNKIHSRGDQILNTSGDPILIHDVGDKVLNEYGEEIPVDGSTLTLGYRLGLTVIDARYRYVTSSDIISYVESLPLVIHGYLKTDLIPIRKTLIERTEMYYKPLGEPETIEVLIGDDEKLIVPATLYPIVTFSIDPDFLQKKDILDKIKTTCRTLIGSYITNTTISIDGLYEQIKTIKSKAIIGYTINQLLPNNLQIVTVTKGSFNIGEEMAIASDKSIVVEDVIKIYFKKAI